MTYHAAAPRRFRAIFISDVHLGTRRAQTDKLLDFLRATESDQLYVIGDLIDNWALRKRWYWDQKHNDVIQKLLRKARKGSRVIYVPGNHDENFRAFSRMRFGRVAVLHETTHISATGKRYLVIHGDKFDAVVRLAPWLAKMGDTAYEFAMDVNVVVTKIRRFLRLPYWSLSAFLKNKVKRAVEFISHFETAVVRDARERGCYGVICGHIHTAENRMIDGIHYLNDGDWVESCTALVEHFDGRFEIIDWRNIASVKVDQPALESQLPAITAALQ
ncbi:MAG: UDP-2,3-diacylglucosamine diphosphatase [Proteobacteria bacterium]|nr:UDP-2,3-diacylglucosamine diphosphatase [Pseudomonadota bacterium]